MITPQQLDGFLGKSIGDICQNGYTSSADNHCAHFVAHVLGYKFGVTCQMMGSAKGPAANLRVQEIFPKCLSVGVWSLRPVPLITCLAFITKASNVNLAAKTMANVPRKHIGIYAGGFIYHYSNSQQRVVRQTPSQFSQHYPAPHNAMFYGSMPPARP
jgi:hypothetical protein